MKRLAIACIVILLSCLDGLAAGNRHIDNPTFPVGEICGQLAAVPEPATALLLACPGKRPTS